MGRVPEPSAEGDLPRRVAVLWALSARISPRSYPRGVFKFRSIEEARQARERVVTENVRRLRQEREQSGG